MVTRRKDDPVYPSKPFAGHIRRFCPRHQRFIPAELHVCLLCELAEPDEDPRTGEPFPPQPAVVSAAWSASK